MRILLDEPQATPQARELRRLEAPAVSRHLAATDGRLEGCQCGDKRRVRTIGSLGH